MNKVIKARRATLLMFLICGISVSTWAPMVPLAKERTGVSEKGLGLLLLMMGVGAIITMPFVGRLIYKNGSRKIIISSSIVIALMLPLLAVVSHPLVLGIVLFVFGAAIGALDVAMNSQAVVVERALQRPAMSSFHGMFSVGGLTGALAFGLFLSVLNSPLGAVLVISATLLLMLITHHSYFLPHPQHEEKTKVPFRFPKLTVLILGIFCFITFMMEGALLDWSALFLQQNRGFSIAASGIGYSIFSIAMAIMRFTGDKLAKKFNPNKIVFWGALISAAGLLLAILLPYQFSTLLGFFIIGIGAANIVPIIFSSSGKADPKSPELALAAITTMGYTGQLAGPALIGFAAEYYTLPIALGSLAIPMALVAIGFINRNQKAKEF